MGKRTYTADELIGEFQDSASRASRLGCPIVDHLKEMQEAGATVGDMVMWTMCDCGPRLPAFMLVDTVTHNEPDVAGEVQEKCAHALAFHDWGKVRVHIERMLLDDLPKIGDAALIVLIAIIIEQHPNPGGFLAQIEARVPDTVRAHFAALEPDPWPI